MTFDEMGVCSAEGCDAPAEFAHPADLCARHWAEWWADPDEGTGEDVEVVLKSIGGAS